jgi:hypothetical protein
LSTESETTNSRTLIPFKGPTWHTRRRLGAFVHYLDVGGIPVPEAAGLAAIVSGARALQPNDGACAVGAARGIVPAAHDGFAGTAQGIHRLLDTGVWSNGIGICGSSSARAAW